jgi:hypothetical protein
MFAIRRFVCGWLTPADTVEQHFSLLCAINVPLTARLAVLLSPEAALALSHHPATGIPGHILKEASARTPGLFDDLTNAQPATSPVGPSTTVMRTPLAMR